MTCTDCDEPVSRGYSFCGNCGSENPDGVRITPERADQIRKVWGIFLEYNLAKYQMLFLAKIPESLLPYPKSELNDALRFLEREYMRERYAEGVKLIQETLSTLNMNFIDDEEALLAAAKNFNNPEWRKHFLPSLKEIQKEWAEIAEGPRGAANR